MVQQGAQTVNQVFAGKSLWAWFNSGVTQYFNGSTEKGQDYSNTWGTSIAVPVGGKILRIVHNTSTINDVVELQDSSGAVWLYQHINTSVSVGQNLNCGDIIGTENGCTNNDAGGYCAIDQYSTGPHIEVRYCPSGWSPLIISWLEPWINPMTVFATIGNQTAGTTSSGGSGSPPPGTWWWPFGNTSSFNSFLDNLGASAQKTPLMAGASVTQALSAMDNYLYLINPFVFTNGEPTFTIGSGSIGPISGPSLTLPDPIAYIQDVALVMAQDAGAFLIRLVLVAVGVSILIKVANALIDFQAIGTSIKNTVNPTGISPEQAASVAGAFL